MSGTNVKPLPRALQKSGDPRVASAGANARRADDMAAATQQRENRLGIERRSAWDHGAADAGTHWEQVGWGKNPKEFVGTETASTDSEVVPAYDDGWSRRRQSAA